MVCSKRNAISICMGVLVVCCNCWSQTATPTPLNTLAQAVRAALVAHGAGWESGRVDSVAEGTLVVHALTGSKGTYQVSLLQKGTSKVQRIIKPAKGGEIRQGSDGAQKWFSQSGPFTLKTVPEDISTFIESQTIRSLQAFFSVKEAEFEDRGNGSKGRAIAFKDRAGRTTTYYIDPASSLITRMEFTVDEAKGLFGKPIPVIESYVFSDYRLAQGLRTPFRIERYRNAVKMEEMQFVSVSHAAPVSDQSFRP
jgi:hypothetical protein